MGKAGSKLADNSTWPPEIQALRIVQSICDKAESIARKKLGAPTSPAVLSKITHIRLLLEDWEEAQGSLTRVTAIPDMAPVVQQLIVKLLDDLERLKQLGKQTGLLQRKSKLATKVGSQDTVITSAWCHQQHALCVAPRCTATMYRMWGHNVIQQCTSRIWCNDVMQQCTSRV
jgi:hypothetical protein